MPGRLSASSLLFIEAGIDRGTHRQRRDVERRHQLALAPGTLVVRLRRVRLADGVAMSFDETYLPRDLGEKVAGNDLEAEPVFALLENKYDTPLVEAEYKLEAAAVDPVAAEALQVPAGSLQL